MTCSRVALRSCSGTFSEAAPSRALPTARTGNVDPTPWILSYGELTANIARHERVWVQLQIDGTCDDLDVRSRPEEDRSIVRT